MVITTTTKTINYSITKGQAVNSVTATVTSTPGCNSTYLTRLPGILKLIELLLALAAVILLATLREQSREVIRSADYYQYSYVSHPWLTYLHEHFLVGEAAFIAAQTVALFVLLILLISYLSSTTSAMIVPKTTNLEKTANIVLAVVLLIAGVQEVVLAVLWRYDEAERTIMEVGPFGVRVAAGALSLLNGLLFVVSAVLSAKELAGPKTL
ncbi:hypothetical protein BV898_16710 [Hypsibius exemplaris]|uniref:MARVEL domain-containing protein n=1 Tax=Hypsibius exemplaris TaxID=2072580 RepID=A0A9X6RLX0_HYPEX|nr:hypothetical protein BV898_16710 [Hypsibius exemplaris]